MRLEYNDRFSNSHKFVDIRVIGSKVVTKYGRIGIKKPAQVENKFSSVEEANNFAKKKINTKLNKGYSETKWEETIYTF